MNDTRQIKSYVWHGDKCFFVSTIERDSSAATEPPPRRFNETLVWEYDWDSAERGMMLHQEGDGCSRITIHLEVCQQLYRNGTYDNEAAEQTKATP